MIQKLMLGQWCKGSEPMQVVWGPYGREIVHYEAPPSENILAEMKILWIGIFNQDYLLMTIFLKPY